MAPDAVAGGALAAAGRVGAAAVGLAAGVWARTLVGLLAKTAAAAACTLLVVAAAAL
jgi:hypothetical protein